jgi:hypothetical protein
MGKFGGFLGSLAGSIGSKVLPIPGIDGGALGGFLGSLAPFKTGGRISGGRNQPRVILAHGSEYVLPANARPTKKQRSIVAGNKRRAKKSKK